MVEREVERDAPRRFFQRSIRAFVVRDGKGLERVVHVRHTYSGARVLANLTWRGFRARPGDCIVAMDLSCGHRVAYSRPQPPGSLRTAGPCPPCKAGLRGAWESELAKRRVRTVVLEIASSPSTLRVGEADLQATRLENLVEFILAAIDARCLPSHSQRAEDLFGRMDRYGRLAGLMDRDTAEADDDAGATD